MRNYNGIDEAALDRHITGNYGEDFFEPNCARPGKNGCGYCEDCLDYEDRQEDTRMRGHTVNDHWGD